MLVDGEKIEACYCGGLDVGRSSHSCFQPTSSRNIRSLGNQLERHKMGGRRDMEEEAGSDGLGWSYCLGRRATGQH